MVVSDDRLFVKSHVARDLLQTAGLFKTDRLVVWEYVSNGLQYVDPGTSPVVRVTLDSKRKRITVADNGRGMDWLGLQNFFVMHGENVDRREGRPGRGLFGTGKAAAFGIANLLRITTVRNGKRSRVQLSRADVQTTTSGESLVPVRTIEREVPTGQANGTTVEIENIQLRSLDQPGTIRYIERHLARWPKNATVFVNNHECEFAEPLVARERRFRPEGDLRTRLGDVQLTLKVSMAPLDEDLRGVSILANGVWHDTTLAGSEGREMSQYIFGEIDVPGLDEGQSVFPAFDMTRSMRLNPNNEIVQAIMAFVGQRIEEVRRGLVEEEKKRRADEEARKLAQQAAEIARVINEDFKAFRERLAQMRAKAGGGSDLRKSEEGGGDEDDLVLFGSQIPAEIISETGGPGSCGGVGANGTEPRDLNPQAVAGDSDASKQGRAAGGERGQRKPSGGFLVRFDEMGAESPRAKYVRDERTIYINVDHPQLDAAKGLGSTEDPAFRRLAYEVAFAEYAIALAVELAARGEYLDPSDPIVDIRDTLNRVALKGAVLYSA